MSVEAIASVERRAAVDREFARLELEGPPEGTRYNVLQDRRTTGGQQSAVVYMA